ncbi:hypothetical protein EC973_007876 [Apophysomyces ossiformis]|uniref:Transcription factor domain-containing protein n=1 Tax=Apophysomyces ossiformis TaxID=679940 RepID=A0A8H7BU99_9FUNG|nr:hypothetical protein EC973_007876 [Apophysomyces ossiformis]
MAELVLGPHNGVMIKGTRPRRPKKRKQKEPVQTDKDPPSLSPLHLPYSRISQLPPSEQWTVQQTSKNEYRITLRNVCDVKDLLQALAQMTIQSPLQSTFLAPSPDEVEDHQMIRRHSPPLPYLFYHSELYSNVLWEPEVEWPRFNSVLPGLLDDCMHYFIECMNHYYPVRPRQLLVQWYASLDAPIHDPLVLAVAAFWVRHIFIHHPPITLQNLHDGRILDAVQLKLAAMARDALADCFDVPHIHHVYALCLLNMTTTLPVEQKVLYHTMAVRLANLLNIKPLQFPSTDDDELDNRLWWYLFQIDHFLHESGAIACSILQPNSDDHDALTRLLRPYPCSLDDPDEQRGIDVWSNVLKIWLVRRRLVREIDHADPADQSRMATLYARAMREVECWSQEIPVTLKPEIALEPDHYGRMAEACLTISMEKCTNLALLAHRFLSAENTLTALQRQAVLTVADNSTELISMRQSVVQMASCQTWPGDLKRSVELLSFCLRYDDTVIVTRAKLGLMRALRLLRSMAEVHWQDQICVSMISKIEQILSPTDSEPQKRRSIKIANNLYEGVMMFDRELQPRAQYYNPTMSDPIDAFDSITIIQNAEQWKK